MFDVRRIKSANTDIEEIRRSVNPNFSSGLTVCHTHFHGIMTMQYRGAGTVLLWPSLIYSAEQQKVGRTILRKSLLRLSYGVVKSTPLITTYAINSSRLPRAQENEKSPADSAKIISGSRVFHQPNAVGIIGGASAPATADFVKKVVQWTSAEAEESLPLLLCSNPQLKQVLYSSPAEIDLGTSGKSVSSDQVDSVLAVLMEKRMFLESSGVSCIVMPCHVSHAWYPELSQGCSVPFLHIGDCVARELEEANLKPIETGSNVKIGLLGTEETLFAGFYQDKLSNQGFEVVLPDQATMEHIVVPAIGALRRKDIEGARILLRIALQILLVRAVSMVVLASYDMRSLLAPDDPLLKKCIDPIDTLARATVKWSHSVRNIT